MKKKSLRMVCRICRTQKESEIQSDSVPVVIQLTNWKLKG